MSPAVRSIAAAASDFTLAAVLSVLTASRLGAWCGERAVLALAIDDPDSWWRGPLPLVLGVLGNVVYSLPFTLIAVGLAQLAFGRSPGQVLCGVQPRPSDTTAMRRLATWAGNYATPLLLVLALLVGRLRVTEIVLAAIGVWILLRVARRVRNTQRV